MKKQPIICFDTKCWEGDWEFILKTKRLQEMISRNNYHFSKKILIINNVSKPDLVRSFAQKAKENHIIDDYYFISDYIDKTLKYFKIGSDFQKNSGFVYSISELVSIYLAQGDYLVHFSSDAILEKPFNWIDEALTIFSKNPNITVINPCWNRKYLEAKNESIDEKPSYYLGFGFSDQCYMAKLSDFKKPIYNHHHSESERYPKYGGELFEKRIDAWMRNQKKYRATLKNISYIHQNFPKNQLIKKLRLWVEAN